jgi:cytochrome c-type biogenesis protein CcmH/NrfG
MRRDRRANARDLLVDVNWAIENGLGPRDLIPMLTNLERSSEVGSPSWVFALRELAPRLLEHDPWRAALVAKKCLAHEPAAETWGILGLALSLLGHYQSAVAAYRRGLALDPRCPVLAHNLGHLLDVGLDRPRRGLHFLIKAHRADPNDIEILASYAHALVRTGRALEAMERLSARLPGGVDEARQLVDSWTVAK